MSSPPRLCCLMKMAVVHQGALLAGTVLADILGILAEIQVLAGTCLADIQGIVAGAPFTQIQIR